jgi:hypothetical protein
LNLPLAVGARRGGRQKEGESDYGSGNFHRERSSGLFDAEFWAASPFRLERFASASTGLWRELFTRFSFLIGESHEQGD